ncbi:transposase (plasmid) [Komagataeibacter medellinensis NBRC 3288]|uniref:Transposase n=1 Tax=Komagataeibacter medellinensis (strain NBRC 3288 / BCRC 11682 / LMG 1693 / Kondo 51) TaxID=634177 RepID=G2I855_KOMMN|nr:transposase [Komagataeibacter medellinensis NBRC 3288]
MPAAQIGRRSARLMLLQDPDDLLLRETCFLHRLSPMDRPYFKSRAFQGAGSRAAKERIAPLFTQKRVAMSMCAFLYVLIGNEPRKIGWMHAEAAGYLDPWR